MRLITLLFKHLLLVLFVLVFVAIAAVIGIFASEPIVMAMARVIPRVKPFADLSIPIGIVFFTFVLSGLLLGVGAVTTLDYGGLDASNRTYKGSLLGLLAATLAVVLGTIAGGMMTVSRYRASLPPPDPDAGGI